MTVDTLRIRTDFATARANDGKIDAREAKLIIDHARQDRLTYSEAQTLKRQMKVNKDAFDPEAAQAFNDFSKIIRRNTVLDPPPPGTPVERAEVEVLPVDVARLEWREIANGELFRNGISYKDPEQLYLGDCFLMAAMSAVAAMSPKEIDKMFKKTGPNEYTVRLYNKRGQYMLVPVSTKLPGNKWYGWYYGRAHDPKELWPALLEKAFAKKAGGYSKIDGGLSGDAMQAMTGKKSVDTLTRGNRITAEQMYAKIKDAVDNKKPITAATYGHHSQAKYAGTNIFADHTYVVLKAKTIGGKDYVWLRNPWGNTEPAGNGRDDGIFKIEMSTFMKLFWGISVNG